MLKRIIKTPHGPVNYRNYSQHSTEKAAKQHAFIDLGGTGHYSEEIAKKAEKISKETTEDRIERISKQSSDNLRAALIIRDCYEENSFKFTDLSISSEEKGITVEIETGYDLHDDMDIEESDGVCSGSVNWYGDEYINYNGYVISNEEVRISASQMPQDDCGNEYDYNFDVIMRVKGSMAPELFNEDPFFLSCFEEWIIQHYHDVKRSIISNNLERYVDVFEKDHLMQRLVSYDLAVVEKIEELEDDILNKLDKEWYLIDKDYKQKDIDHMEMSLEEYISDKYMDEIKDECCEYLTNWGHKYDNKWEEVEDEDLISTLAGYYSPVEMTDY